jgi:membrane protein
LLFGLYVSEFAPYNKTYGALGGIVMFLVWLWITNIAVLFGAALNAQVEARRGGKPVPEETIVAKG